MATTLGNGNGVAGVACAANIPVSSKTLTGVPATSLNASQQPQTLTQQQQQHQTLPCEDNMELKLSTELFELIRRNHNEIENVIISPLLLESMLALLYLGSDGATAQQLKNILQLKRFNESNTKMANYYAAHLEMAAREASDTKLQMSQIILLHEQHQMAEEFQRIAKKYFRTNAKTTAPSIAATIARTEKETKDTVAATATATVTTSSNIQSIENSENMKNMENLQSQINDSLAKISIRPLKESTFLGSAKDATTPAPEGNAATSNGRTSVNACNSGIVESSSSAIPHASVCSKDNDSSDDGSDGSGAAHGSGDCIVALAANLKNKWFLPFSGYRSGLYDFHSDLNLNSNRNSDSSPDSQSESESKLNSNASPNESSSSQSFAISVPMLFDDDMFVKFGEFRDLDARAIELPFECHVDNELSMLLILPNQRDGGLPSLLDKLKAVDLNALTDNMQMENVQVLMPKLSLEFELSLKPYLQQLGLGKIFSKDANFKNLLSSESRQSVRFDDFVQKFKLIINESGSEETQGQALKPLALSSAFTTNKKFFRADHPFYFAIRNPDVTYLMGCVNKL